MLELINKYGMATGGASQSRNSSVILFGKEQSEASKKRV